MLSLAGLSKKIGGTTTLVLITLKRLPIFGQSLNFIYAQFRFFVPIQ